MAHVHPSRVRKRASAPIEVYFLTDPLCPWSWAMEPLVTSLRSNPDIEFRSIMAGWLPSLAARGVDAVKGEWADAAAKTGGRIDPAYWDRVAPKTSLLAGAAVKAAELQGAAKGEVYLSLLRRAAFEKGEDVANVDVLVALAEPAGLRSDFLRVDVGVGRYTLDEVLKALDPGMPLSESVWWFGRRKMLRSWDALSSDIRAAERQGLTSPAFHVVHGKREAVVRGFATDAQFQAAIKSVQ